jgi:hypothetical protein
LATGESLLAIAFPSCHTFNFWKFFTAARYLWSVTYHFSIIVILWPFLDIAHWLAGWACGPWTTRWLFWLFLSGSLSSLT